MRAGSVADFSLDLTDLSSGKGQKDRVELRGQLLVGLSLGVESRGTHAELTNLDLLLPFAETRLIPGQPRSSSASLSFLAEPVEAGLELPDLDEIVSEVFRLTLLTTPGELEEEVLVQDLLERGELEEGLVMVHGMLIRVEPTSE